MSRKERQRYAEELKKLPHFRNEAEERAFWESQDTADYFDLSKARRVRFPNLKLSTTAISLRLPRGHARPHQDRSKQTGYAVSVADQVLADEKLNEPSEEPP